MASKPGLTGLTDGLATSLLYFPTARTCQLAESGDFPPYPRTFGGLNSPKPPEMSVLVGGNGADDCHERENLNHSLKIQNSTLLLYGVKIKAEAGAGAGFDFDELDRLVAIA